MDINTFYHYTKLNYSNFKALEIPIPSLEVQTKIVEYLDFIYEKCNKTSEDKIQQLKKMNEFVDTYATENSLCSKDKSALYDFLTSSIDQKKLSKTKEVIYDKLTGTIKSIPCLVYCPTSIKKFTLKRCEKRQSTLKSLAPKNKVKPPKQASSSLSVVEP